MDWQNNFFLANVKMYDEAKLDIWSIDLIARKNMRSFWFVIERHLELKLMLDADAKTT